MIEKGVQPWHPFGHRFYSLQTNRDAIIGEGEFDMGEIGLTAKIAVFTPHAVEYSEAAPPSLETITS